MAKSATKKKIRINKDGSLRKPPLPIKSLVRAHKEAKAQAGRMPRSKTGRSLRRELQKQLYPERTETHYVKHGGRKKGSVNKFPGLLKEAILEGARLAGSRLKYRPAKDDLINYLSHQAEHNPQSFMSLLGRVMPLQLEADGVKLIMIDKIEMVVVDGRSDPDGTLSGDEVITSLENSKEIPTSDVQFREVQGSVGRTR